MDCPVKKLHEPWQLGHITLPNRVLYSPLAGCSDLPFRRMAAKYRPGLIFCEMVKMDAIVRYDPGTFHMLDYETDMHPIGAQLCGSKVELAAPAARIIEDLGFDVVDFNCGCPVDKITKDGSGSGMLKNPQRIGDIISNIVAAVSIPVTVKIRAGWDDANILAPEITRIAEEAGAAAITIHGRTREQAYKGNANWDYIQRCRAAATKSRSLAMEISLNRKTPCSMQAHTQCDAVMVSRGTMGQPWMARDIIKLSQGESLTTRDMADFRQELLEHFLHTVDYEQEQGALISMRRIGCWYFKSSSGTREFRHRISRASSVKEVRQLIADFPFGVEPHVDA